MTAAITSAGTLDRPRHVGNRSANVTSPCLESDGEIRPGDMTGSSNCNDSIADAHMPEGKEPR